jgi:hypothetical protein
LVCRIVSDAVVLAIAGSWQRTTIEAVIGQIYLVTFVALIVGLIVGQREHRVDAE